MHACKYSQTVHVCSSLPRLPIRFLVAFISYKFPLSIYSPVPHLIPYMLHAASIHLKVHHTFTVYTRQYKKKNKHIIISYSVGCLFKCQSGTSVAQKASRWSQYVSCLGRLDGGKGHITLPGSLCMANFGIRLRVRRNE